MKNILDNLVFKVDDYFIENGKRKCRIKCALALALKHRLKFNSTHPLPDAEVEVGWVKIQVKLEPEQNGVYLISMTKAIRNWIEAWDDGENVSETRIKIRKSQNTFAPKWEAFPIGETDLEVTT